MEVLFLQPQVQFLKQPLTSPFQQHRHRRSLHAQRCYLISCCPVHGVGQQGYEKVDHHYAYHKRVSSMRHQQYFDIADVIRCVIDHVEHRDEQAVDDSEQAVKAFDTTNVSVGVDNSLKRMHERYHENDEYDAEIQQVLKNRLNSKNKASD